MSAHRSPATPVLATILLLAACSGAPSSPGASQDADAGSQPAHASEPADSEAPVGELPDSCTLLSGDEVGTLMGEAAGDPQPGLNATGDDESFCEWEKADSTPFPLKLLQLQVFVSTQYLSRSAYEGEPVQDVTLTGAEGPFVVVGDREITLNFAASGRRVVATYSPGGDEDPNDFLEALLVIGSAIIGRLA